MRATLLKQTASKAGRGREAAVAFFSVARLAALGLLAGALGFTCSDVQAEPVTNVQVALWETGLPGEKECVKQLVRAFQEAHPEVLVAVEWRDGLEAEQYVEDWCGKYSAHAPDMTVMSDLWVQRHCKQLLPLNRGLQKNLWDRFVPSVLARGAVDRALLGVPWTVATQALYCRSDLFAQAEAGGLRMPRNFEELVERAAELADPPETYGFGLPGVGGGAEELLYALAVSSGEELAEDDGEIKPTAPAFERALGLLIDLQSRGALQPEVLTWTEADLAELFAQGRLAMMVGRPWLGVMLEGAEKPVQYTAVPLPREPRGTGSVATDWLVAFSNTDRREQALELLRFVAGEFCQRELAEIGGVPATRALAGGLRGAPRWAAHIQGLERARGLPSGQWVRLKAQLANALTYALSGRRGVSEALEEAEATEL